METDANKLVERDPKTNAIIPVLQTYADDLENTEVVSNRLYVRGEKDAFIPVVKVIGAATNNALAKKADLVDGYVPSYQLPSYVDDVIEGELVSDTEFSVEGFIIVPEHGKIYVDTVTNLTYRWSGSVYVEISKSATKESLGLANVDNTSDLNKPVSKAQQEAIEKNTIGGINLISNLPANWEQGTLNSGGAKGSSFKSLKIESINRIRTKELIDVNSSCSISWSNSDTNTKYKIFAMLFDDNLNYLGVNSVEWKTSKFIIPDKVSKIAIIVSTTGDVTLTVNTFNFLKIMLERGNKYSQWTPSLADIQNRLLALESK